MRTVLRTASKLEDKEGAAACHRRKGGILAEYLAHSRRINFEKSPGVAEIRECRWFFSSKS
jgi:hypothetical protein